MKVAVISSGNPHNLKGVMNFVWEKVRRLSQLEGIDVDYYIVRTTSSYLNSILLRIFKKGSQVSSAIRINQENINGLNINYLWFTRTILDQFVLKFVNRSPIPQRVLRRFEKTFEKYDIFIIRKSKFPQNPKRSVRFSGKGTKRSVQKRKARNTQKAETKVL